MTPNSLIIHTIAAIVLFHVVNSNLTREDHGLRVDSLKTISEEIKWLRPLRVKRSAIVYNKCPSGYVRMPPPINCISCRQYEAITGESC